jgi:prepilin-type N-terminal cleavage/methylation domain-containing protein
MRRLARRADLRSRAGYTLVELIAVLAIFLGIATALVSLFASGARAELDLNRRFQAQQQARLALDKLRRELRCSNGVTVGPDADGDTAVESITVSLPSQCPTAQGVQTNIVYDTSVVSAGRWELRRTKGDVTNVLADHLTNGDPFTYMPQSGEGRALLHVDIPVNVYPNGGSNDWRLVDDIVLRNTLRQDPS